MNISWYHSYRYKVSTGFFSSPLVLRSSSSLDSRDSHDGTLSSSTSEEDADAATSPPRKETKAGLTDDVDGDLATNPWAHLEAVGPVAKIATNDKRAIDEIFVMASLLSVYAVSLSAKCEREKRWNLLILENKNVAAREREEQHKLNTLTHFSSTRTESAFYRKHTVAMH